MVILLNIKLKDMIEIWRDIKDYEGLYQVSNFGRVRNSRTGKLIKPYKTKCGYLQLLLCKNGITKHCLVHRLVAMTFPDLVDWTEEAKGKPFEELEVNHKDEFNKTNNCVDNLEWCDRKYNINYGTGLHRRAISRGKPVLQYTLNGQFVAEYPSAAEAERQTGIHRSKIVLVCQGKRNKTGGYIWKYK